MLHIGGVRTALYSYAMAKKHGGVFVLRIEDTDRDRFSQKAVDDVYKALAAYGIEPDESDRHGGAYGPYTQSERLQKYHACAEELIACGAAYKCFLTKEEAEELKQQNKAANLPFRSPHRSLSAEEIKERLENGSPYVVRFAVPDERKIDYLDGVQGKMQFDTSYLDDQVLLKSDGFPTYHLAMLVDDHEMEISHVFRAFEWIPSIPLHVLLYEALGWQMPAMFHLSTILDPEGGKLSKRKGATAAMEFLEQGYLPEAVLNFLMLLGWASPLPHAHGEAEREMYSLQEFVELFDPADLNKNNPVFNREKLLWFNRQYLATTADSLLAGKLVDWVSIHPGKSDLETEILHDSQLGKKLSLVKQRASTLVEIVEMLRFFYHKPTNVDWHIPQLARVSDDMRAEILTDIKSLMTGLGDNSAEWWHDAWESGMRAIADKHQLKHGDVFMLLRVAVVGTPISPPLFESLQLLGLEEVLHRI